MEVKGKHHSEGWEWGGGENPSSALTDLEGFQLHSWRLTLGALHLVDFICEIRLVVKMLGSQRGRAVTTLKLESQETAWPQTYLIRERAAEDPTLLTPSCLQQGKEGQLEKVRNSFKGSLSGDPLKGHLNQVNRLNWIKGHRKTGGKCHSGPGKMAQLERDFPLSMGTNF